MSFRFTRKCSLIARARTLWDAAVRVPGMDKKSSAISWIFQYCKVLEPIFSPFVLLESASQKVAVWMICTELEFNKATRTGCRGKRMTIHFFTSSLITLALIIHLWDQHVDPESDKTLTIVSKAKILFTLWKPTDFQGTIFTRRVSGFRKDQSSNPYRCELHSPHHLPCVGVLTLVVSRKVKKKSPLK